MSDYSRQQDFNAKTGTTIFGSEVDTEFDALVTAVNSKVDESREGSASGISTLDGSALVPAGISGTPASGGGQLPEASETALGAVELATAAEAIALSDALRAITPSSLNDVLTAGDGVLGDLNAISGASVDTLFGYDFSTTTSIAYVVANGLEIDTVTLQINDTEVSGVGITATAGVFAIDFLGLEALVDPDADSVFGWDDTAGAAAFFAPADGVSVDNAASTFGLTDVAADATNAIDIASGAVTLDFASLTALSIEGTAATDSIVFNDGGVLKQMDIQDMGIRIVTSAIAQTFTKAQCNTLQLLTGSSTIVWDVPTDANEPLIEPGHVIYLGARDTGAITLSPNTSAVTLTSVLRSDIGPTAGDHTVNPGGVAALIKVAANEWMVTGDIG